VYDGSGLVIGVLQVGVAPLPRATNRRLCRVLASWQRWQWRQHPCDRCGAAAACAGGEQAGHDGLCSRWGIGMHAWSHFGMLSWCLFGMLSWCQATFSEADVLALQIIAARMSTSLMRVRAVLAQMWHRCAGTDRRMSRLHWRPPRAGARALPRGMHTRRPRAIAPNPSEQWAKAWTAEPANALRRCV
jgi:hypothetical protein